MQYFRVNGGKKLSGTLQVNTSKNATVALLAASVFNRGTTTLKNVPDIEEVNRWVEILESIGMEVLRSGRTLTLIPRRIDITKINKTAAVKTRSVILLLGALVRHKKSFLIPQSGGCLLGTRSVFPHIHALQQFGMTVKARSKDFKVSRKSALVSPGRFALYESGDTVTENALFVAAQTKGTTEIRMASANYMIQDVCFFLQKCGVRIDGIGTTTLRVHGIGAVKKDVVYEISEDPIEAMFFLSVAIATKSTMIITRCPFDFLELELLKLEVMGLTYKILRKYTARNNKTVLVDILVEKSRLRAVSDKIEPRPFPGLNIDNLPFFAVIAATAKGDTLIHDWVFENRAIYFTELKRLGVRVRLLDPHRVMITGPTSFRNARMTCPPALRPGAVVLVAMLAAPGQSILKDVYMINRGYENLAERLQAVGADLVMIHK